MYLDEDGDGMLDAVVVVARLMATSPARRHVLDCRRVGYHGLDDAGIATWVSLERP